MEKFLLRNVGVSNSHEIDVYIERECEFGADTGM